MRLIFALLASKDLTQDCKVKIQVKCVVNFITGFVYTLFGRIFPIQVRTINSIFVLRNYVVFRFKGDFYQGEVKFLTINSYPNYSFSRVTFCGTHISSIFKTVKNQKCTTGGTRSVDWKTSMQVPPVVHVAVNCQHRSNLVEFGKTLHFWREG